MSLLIRFNGDPLRALNSKEVNQTYYCVVSKEILKILAEINSFSSDSLLGVKLMVNGLMGLSKAEAGGTLQLVEQYYDQNDLGKGIKLADRLKMFSDKRRMYRPPDFTGGTDDFPKENIIKRLESVSYNECKKDDDFLSQEAFQRRINYLKDYPLSLVSAYFPHKEEKIALSKVTSDEKASLELQAIVDKYFSNYKSRLEAKFQKQTAGEKLG